MRKVVSPEQASGMTNGDSRDAFRQRVIAAFFQAPIKFPRHERLQILLGGPRQPGPSAFPKCLLKLKPALQIGDHIGQALVTQRLLQPIWHQGKAGGAHLDDVRAQDRFIPFIRTPA